MKRICIYPADVEMIFDLSDRSARKLIQKIKIFYHKKPHQLVTIFEFCEYMDVRLNDIAKYLR